MKTFTLTCAFYDCWTNQTVVVEADNVEDACQKAIELADDERADHYQRESWDPGRTFVAGIVEGGDLEDMEDDLHSLSNVIGQAGPDIPVKFSEAATVAKDLGAAPTLQMDLGEALEAARALAGSEPCAGNLPLHDRLVAAIERLERGNPSATA